MRYVRTILLALALCSVSAHGQLWGLGRQQQPAPAAGVPGPLPGADYLQGAQSNIAGIHDHVEGE